MSVESIKETVLELLPAVGENSPGVKAVHSPVPAVAPAVQMKSVDARNEVIIKLLGTLASIGISVVAIRYMMNALDPTKKEKRKARERVCLPCICVLSD